MKEVIRLADFTVGVIGARNWYPSIENSDTIILENIITTTGREYFDKNICGDMHIKRSQPFIRADCVLSNQAPFTIILTSKTQKLSFKECYIGSFSKSADSKKSHIHFLARSYIKKIRTKEHIDLKVNELYNITFAEVTKSREQLILKNCRMETVRNFLDYLGWHLQICFRPNSTPIGVECSRCRDPIYCAEYIPKEINRLCPACLTELGNTTELENPCPQIC